MATAPDLFAVVSGDLSEASLSEDLEDLGDGVVSHGTGDDFTGDLAETSVVSRLGRPTRFAAHGDRIAVSPSTPAVEQWLDGESEVPGASLHAVADALDEAGVYAAVLHEPADGFSLTTVLGAASPAVVEAFEDKDWLPPVVFNAVGVGWSVEGNEPVVTIAVAHADEDAAQENAGAFGRMLEEGESLRYGRPLSAIYDLQDVRANGATVVITVELRSGVPLPIVFQAVTEGDAPFVHA